MPLPPARRGPVLLLLILGLASAGAASPVEELGRLRDGLVAELEGRLAEEAGRPAARRVLLHLQGGMRYRSPTVVDRRDGLSFRDLRWSGHHGAGAWGLQGGDDIPLERVQDRGWDPGGLALDAAGRCHGLLRWRQRRGDHQRDMERFTINMQGVVKSRVINVMDWHIGGIWRTRDHLQEFEVAAEPLPGGVWLDATVVGLFRNDATLALQLVCHPDQGVLLGEALAQRWNRGLHRIAAADLAIVEGRLRGSLRLELAPDQWVGRGRDGFTVQELHLDAPLDGAALDATCCSSGELGERDVRIRGRALQALTGHYATTLPDVRWEGPLWGGLAPLRRRLPAALRADGDLQGAALTRQRYRQIDALLTLRAAPRPDLTGSLQAIAGEAVPGPEQVAWVAAACAAPPPLVGVPVLADTAFGPWYPDLPAAPQGGDGAARVPTGPGWWRLDGWTARGPLPVPAGALTQLPDPGIASVPGAAWQPRWDGRRHGLAAALHQALLASEQRDPVWYAVGRLRLDQAQRLWLAIQVDETGMLWIDGRPVWRSGRDHGHGAVAVFPVDLAAGTHELLVRVQGRASFGRYNDGLADGGGFVVSCHAGPGPRQDPPATGAATLAQARAWRNDGSGAWPAGETPLAWSLLAGTNVRWDQELPLDGTVVAGDGALIATCSDGSIRGLDGATGTERWRCTALAGPWSEAPVLSGTGIWAVTRRGGLIHLDHQGQQRWRIGLEGLPGELGSARLAGSVLVVAAAAEQGGLVIGLDAASGAERWRTPLRRSCRHLAVSAVTAPGVVHWAVVSSGGSVLDAADGAVICTAVHGGPDCDLAPLVRGTQLVLRGGEVGAILVVDAAGRLGCRPLWDVLRYRKYGYPDWPVDPAMAADGLVYALRAAPEHSTHGPFPADHLYQIDSVSGLLLGHRKPLIEDCLSPGSVTMVGDRLYAANTGAPGFAVREPRPRIAVAQSAEPPVILATSDSLPGRVHPVADGDRLYLGGAGRLVCLQVDEGPGRRHEARSVVDTLVAREIGRRPPQPTIRDIAPLPTPARAADTAINPLLPGCAGPHWLWSGAAATTAAAEDPVLPPGLEGLVRRGQPLGERRFVDLPVTALRHEVTAADRAGVAGFVDRHSFDPIRLLGREQGRDCWLATVWRNDRARVVQVELVGSGAAVWVHGRAVADEDLLRLAVGDYPVLMRIRLGRIPHFMTAARIAFDLRSVADPAASLAEWEAGVARLRPWLEWAQERDPGGSGGDRATFLLQALAPR